MANYTYSCTAVQLAISSSCQAFKPLLANSSRPELLMSTVTMHITSCNRIKCRTVELNGLSDKRSHVNSLKAELVTANCLMCKQLAVSCLSGRLLCMSSLVIKQVESKCLSVTPRAIVFAEHRSPSETHGVQLPQPLSRLSRAVRPSPVRHGRLFEMGQARRE